MIYKPTKVQLDNMIQDIASEIVNRITKWKFFADQLNSTTNEDLAALGYDASTIAYIRSFQAALINLELRYRNQTPANSDDPSYFISQMTRVSVF
jgi:hypothetical protein